MAFDGTIKPFVDYIGECVSELKRHRELSRWGKIYGIIVNKEGDKMTFITKEQFDELYFKFKDKPVIDLKDVFAVIEHEFHIDYAKRDNISDEAAKAIFYDEKVFKQLRESEPEENDIASIDEYLKFKNEVFNDKEQL